MDLPAARKVFMSYVQEDAKTAQQIAAELEAHGYSTWYYQRDCQADNYLMATRVAIEQCEAFVLIISPRSIRSEEVTIEVVRALKSQRRKIPLLLEITYDKFEEEQPEWAQALGASAASQVALENPQGIVPALVAGFKRAGIQPDLTPGTPTVSAAPGTAAPGAPIPAVEQAIAPGSGGASSGTGPAAGASLGASASAVGFRTGPATAKVPRRVMILYKRYAKPDEDVLQMLETQLAAAGHKIFIDRDMKAGTEWPKELEQQLYNSYAVIVLLSQAALQSDMLPWEVSTAQKAAREQNGTPYLLPVRVQFQEAVPGELGAALKRIQYVEWTGEQDDGRLVEKLLDVIDHPPPLEVDTANIRPTGGVVPLDSKYYIVRPTDEQFLDAIRRRDSIVLVKGARQMGKTSLLARGLDLARKNGIKAIATDFQQLNSSDLSSIDKFYPAMANLIAEELGLDFSRETTWKADYSPNENFARFMTREVLAKINGPFVWGMDEVDRMFTCDFATDVFALFRSWFNKRSLNPDGPWKNLTMAIVYATEAYLFIKDINQSPFNVGTKLELADFNLEQVEQLNRLYGSPLRGAEETSRFYRIVGGSPYLVHRGLQVLQTDRMSLDEFEKKADLDEGPFGDHLRRIVVMLAKNPTLQDAVRQVLSGKTSISKDDFVRLRSAGVLSGESSDRVSPRSQLYEEFLKLNLA